MRTSAPFCPGLAFAAVVALAPMPSSQAPAFAQDATTNFGTGAERKMIHIVPPARGYLQPYSGRVEIQTLIIHPLITAVDFLLDGGLKRRVSKKPYTGYVDLAHPPRKQTLEVRGYDALGTVLGTDRMILNQPDVAHGVRIASIRRLPDIEHTALRIEAVVSVPRSVRLEEVTFYLGERKVEAAYEFGVEADLVAPRRIPVEALTEYTPADDFVRVVATFADGREPEDAQLLQGAEYQDEIEIQLIQLQVLVTDRHGNPVRDLGPADFEVREGGVRRRVQDLHTAQDVPLVLGLAIDTSDSIAPIWRQVKDVSVGFLDAALSPGDRAFVVNFAGTVRLASPVTGNKRLLAARLGGLAPRVGTALNDALLFSLLQYGREPGRRALVVVTDGVDQHSRSRPRQSSAFAERLGLPIYFIELHRPRTRIWTPDGYVPARPRPRRHRKRLRNISRQTGGRLFYVNLSADTPHWTERIEQVFDQIEDDLRHQHVLTYYTDQLDGAAIERTVRATRRDLTLRSAVPVEAIEIPVAAIDSPKAQ